MTLIDRHRMSKTIELSALERTLKGPERLLREIEVANLVRAAYDDASGPARAEFMARIKKISTSNWPWSAVAVPTKEKSKGQPGGLQVVSRLTAEPSPSPAILVLLHAQVDTPEADPGNRLPDRGTSEGMAWEHVYKAMDTWDTKSILRHIGPQGWFASVAKDPAPADPPPNPGIVPPDTPPDASPPAPDLHGSSTASPPPPPPVAANPEANPSWPRTAFLVFGGIVVAVVVGTGTYWLTSRRDRQRLDQAMRGGAPS